ncbi:MAG: DUF2723 domain-containing protein [Chlorobi bacterium]|nr:DUF2723 domain-containing protein [Chlorobiota bacterium]
MTHKTYKKYNIILAWLVFLIAFITYYLTVEPTVSLWDCGEFIASSFKLEVGHPPGAPFFMLLARFFALFTSSVQHVAFMINTISVTASAFTILFMFWTITYFADKILIKKDDFNSNNAVAVLLSGIVGSLIYTFSDTFWFSAVEAEVYASSSLFTAVVFWSILKWETISEQKYADRWLILIALLMGISIGVHLLNLLAIPAIVFVYYFKKYKTSKKGIAYASLISVALLAFVMYGIIDGYVVIASKFELLFVNSFGLPYDSGLFTYIILSFGLLIYGIYYSYKKKKILLNTALTMITVILIGYSSYAVIVIRSHANPPMDENNPENVFALLSYLNREQYGSRPLIYGNYYNAEFQKDKSGEIKVKKLYTYIPVKGKYLKIEKTNPEYLYKSSGKTLFPRMYSRDKNHISAYKSWAGIAPGENPTFADNLNFFIKYQLGHMYFRYFMWNFVGRQNNLQSYGGITKGNWISGIPFLDEIMIGNQKNLPDKIKNNKSRNVYYLLPFILGIIGLIFSLSKDKKNFTIIALLFFFTGIAIVMYLNQTPYQPRERDYAYAGSFYAFAIWAGLGVAGIYSYFSEKSKRKIIIIFTALLTLPIPVLMASQNWDDHDRSDRYTARDFAEDYLNSCEKNAILFTYGDNDTFPLWYLQEVEGVRTDIKVVNLSLLGADWYIDQVRRKTYEADPVPFKMKHEKYREGTRDAIYVTENPDIFINEKYQSNSLKYAKSLKSIKTNLIKILSASEYPKRNAGEYKKLISALDTLSLTDVAGVTGGLSDERFISKYKLNKEKVNKFYNNVQTLIDTVSKDYLPLKNAMDFVASDKKNTQLQSSKGDLINYIPSKKLSLLVPWPEAAKAGIFTTKEMSLFEKYIKWKLKKTYIFKNDMAVLEIIARNNWKRPIYFATSVPKSSYNGLQDYLRLEGFALRLVPYKTNENDTYINSDILYDNLMNKGKWGNIDKKNVNVDNYVLRTVRILNIRQTFALLANQLINEGKNDKAEKVLDRCVEITPDYNFTYDYEMFDIAEAYYRIGKTEKANQIINVIYNNAVQFLKYYAGFSEKFKNDIIQDKSQTIAVTNQFAELAKKYNQLDLSKKLTNLINLYIR